MTAISEIAKAARLVFLEPVIVPGIGEIKGAQTFQTAEQMMWGVLRSGACPLDEWERYRATITDHAVRAAVSIRLMRVVQEIESDLVAYLTKENARAWWPDWKGTLEEGEMYYRPQRPVEIYRDNSKWLRRVVELAPHKSVRDRAQQLLADLYLAGSTTDSELEAPSFLDAYTKRLVSDVGNTPENDSWERELTLRIADAYARMYEPAPSLTLRRTVGKTFELKHKFVGEHERSNDPTDAAVAQYMAAFQPSPDIALAASLEFVGDQGEEEEEWYLEDDEMQLPDEWRRDEEFWQTVFELEQAWKRYTNLLRPEGFGLGAFNTPKAWINRAWGKILKLGFDRPDAHVVALIRIGEFDHTPLLWRIGGETLAVDCAPLRQVQTRLGTVGELLDRYPEWLDYEKPEQVEEVPLWETIDLLYEQHFDAIPEDAEITMSRVWVRAYHEAIMAGYPKPYATNAAYGEWRAWHSPRAAAAYDGQIAAGRDQKAAWAAFWRANDRPTEKIIVRATKDYAILKAKNSPSERKVTWHVVRTIADAGELSADLNKLIDWLTSQGWTSAVQALR